MNIVERTERITFDELYAFADEMEIGSKQDYSCLMSMLTDVKAERDKCKWHDLRKNPDDLPERDCDVNVKIDYEDGYIETGIASFRKNMWIECVEFDERSGRMQIPNLYSEHVHVIGWKYI